ncbi:unnamed protein product [Amoebophrya sp. A120]|nr:unnamed protein product [Amoebophrya sp. A120]|eukprot:GSA120T00008149001.1
MRLLLVAATSFASCAVAQMFQPAAPVLPACEGITCGSISCPAPFEFKSAQDAGTCCPVCFSESVVIPGKTPELAKGAETHPNAPSSCFDPVPIFCPPLSCPMGTKETYEEGDCCKMCSVA